jgi:acyl-coenzyme A thioesterase PaaI-like protein
LTAGPVEGRLTPPRGRTAGPGDLGIFADSGLGRAVFTHLGPRGNIRTVNLRLDFTEHCPSSDSLVLTAEADGADGYYLSAGDIRSVAGELVARVSGHFVALPGIAPPTDHPLSLKAPELGLGQEFDSAVDLRIVPAGRGGWATFRVDPMIANRHGLAHGGVLLSVLLQGLTRAMANRTGVPAPRLLSCTTEYYRGVPADGQRVRLEGEMDHAGRRIMVASGRLYARDGRLLTYVRGTFAPFG